MKAGKHSSIISITGGKGGVGKTISSIHLAINTARLGYKTLLIDGDMGLANVDIVLGIHPKYNISDLIEKDLSFQDIIVKTKFDVDIIPSGSGIQELTSISYVNKLQLLDKIEELETQYDYIYVDTAAGISDNVVFFNGCAGTCIIVVTAEPHSIADAYSSIKVISSKFNKKDFYVIVNMVDSESEGDKVFSRLNAVAQKFLGFSLLHLGSVPRDPQLQQAILRQSVGSFCYRTVSGQAYNRIVTRLFDDILTKSSGEEGYFKKIISYTEI